MDIQLNYYNYPEALSQQSRLILDLGIPNNSPTGQTSIEDPDTGEVDNINMNEINDDKVNFIFTGGFQDVLNRTGSKGVVNSFLPYPLFNPDLTIEQRKSFFNFVAYYAGESVVAQLDEVEYGSASQKARLVTNGSANIVSATNPTKYNISIMPQNDLLKGPLAKPNFTLYNLPRGIIVQRAIFSANGLWPSNGYNTGNDLGVSDTIASGAISLKQYNKFIKDLNDTFAEVNVGVVATPYAAKYVTQTDGTLVDVNKSFLIRGGNFTQSISAAVQFLNIHTEIPKSIPANEITPYSMSVKSVFKSQYDSVEQLASEYNDAVASKNDVQILAATQKIEFYQKYTNESVFTDTKIFLPSKKAVQPTSFTNFDYDKMLSYLLLPVDFGRTKTKRTTKVFGFFKVTRYKYTDNGVRWVLVKFVNSGVLSQSRQFTPIGGTLTNVNIPIESIIIQNRIVTIGLSKALQYDVENPPNKVIISGISNSDLNGTFPTIFISPTKLQYEINTTVATAPSPSGELLEVVVPFPKLKGPIEPTPVTFDYEIPALPSDAAIKAISFTSYGPWSQYENDPRLYLSREEALAASPGWVIFNKTSNLLQEMRSGIDVYNKVAFLIKILENAFGSGRVYFTETMRSYEDQQLLQLGGPSSNFLSWHNYGLAARILITANNSSEYIQDGSEDFFKLADIAEAFIADCANGLIGTPMNIVWTAQLATNPNLFDWEFLPIGVQHKDAVKFRDSAYNQQDPIIANAFVNVTEKGWIIPSDGKAPIDVPYVRAGSKADKTATIINGQKWISPSNITNYEIPSNLVLYDIQQFLFLIKNKQAANGSSISGDTTVYDWKSNNSKSFNQLVVYYGLINNLTTARTLLSGDYVERFNQLVETLRRQNPIKFVQTYLGEFYSEAKIIPNDSTSGTYISLQTGLYTFPLLQARSTIPGENGNFFGEAAVTNKTVDFGQYVDGIFVPLTDDNYKYITTDIPVLTGYEKNSNGEWFASGSGEGFVAHDLIAEQIVQTFNEIKIKWESLRDGIMYDSVFDSENTNQIDLMENEFGVISVQDLMPISSLRDMFTRIDVNNQARWNDQGVRGVGFEIGVFEKLVSNAELSGVYQARLTKEKPVIEPMITSEAVNNLMESVNKIKIPSVNDIL